MISAACVPTGAPHYWNDSGTRLRVFERGLAHGHEPALVTAVGDGYLVRIDDVRFLCADTGKVRLLLTMWRAATGPVEGV